MMSAILCAVTRNCGGVTVNVIDTSVVCFTTSTSAKRTSTRPSPTAAASTRRRRHRRCANATRPAARLPRAQAAARRRSYRRAETCPIARDRRRRRPRCRAASSLRCRTGRWQSVSRRPRRRRSRSTTEPCATCAQSGEKASTTKASQRRSNRIIERRSTGVNGSAERTRCESKRTCNGGRARCAPL